MIYDVTHQQYEPTINSLRCHQTWGDSPACHSHDDTGGSLEKMIACYKWMGITLESSHMHIYGESSHMATRKYHGSFIDFIVLLCVVFGHVGRYRPRPCRSVGCQRQYAATRCTRPASSLWPGMVIMVISSQVGMYDSNSLPRRRVKLSWDEFHVALAALL